MYILKLNVTANQIEEGTMRYTTTEYVLQELRAANINPWHVEEVAAFFGIHGEEWKVYKSFMRSI